MNVIMSDARKERQANPFYIDGIPIDLVPCEPTRIVPSELTKQLNAIGLNCSETRGAKLAKNIEEVAEAVGVGTLTTFGVYQDKLCGDFDKASDDVRGIKLPDSSVRGTALLNELLDIRYEQIANGKWEEGSAGKFSTMLRTIQNKENYKYLKEKMPDFPYCEYPEDTISGEYATVDAIKNMFRQAAAACTAATVEGIDRVTLEAIFSNAIEGLNESDIESDYDSGDCNRVITLVSGYDPGTKKCEGVGVVTCDWRLKIKNYKEKKSEPKHKTELTISARSALYTDPDALRKHYDAVLAIHRVASVLGNSFDIIDKVTVFDSLPPADIDTFSQSLLCVSDENYAEAMVFYSSDVQKIGYIDNTGSNAEVKYVKSMTSGFMTSRTVDISTEFNFELDSEVVKAGIKVGFNVSLTDQWSKEQTETIEFNVPAGSSAFLYQVIIQCARLRLDTLAGKYSYVDHGKFLTNSYKTTDKPLYENTL